MEELATTLLLTGKQEDVINILIFSLHTEPELVLALPDTLQDFAVVVVVVEIRNKNLKLKEAQMGW
jgi:hypothetical protein